MAALTWAANADNWKVDSRTLIVAEESCPNGAIDPGETNTVQFVIKNDTDTQYQEVQLELLSDGADLGGGNIFDDSNVEFVFGDPSAKVTVNGRATVSASFRFRAKGDCGRGNFVTPTIRVTRKDGAATLVQFSGDKRFQLGATVASTYTFSNNGQIVLNDFDPNDANKLGRATPYPSTINAANVPFGSLTEAISERVVDVAVTLHGVTHPTDTELAALLVGPRGDKVILFRGAGAFSSINGATFTVNGTAGSDVPRNAPFVSGSTYKAADYGAGDLPGQAAPFEAMSTFDDKNANGAWQLFLVDTSFSAGAGGVVASGWTLTITTEKVVCCGADETFPVVTQYRDGRFRPTINEVKIPEDTIFNSDEVKTGQTKSPLVLFHIDDLETPTELTVAVVSGNESLIKNSNFKVAGASDPNNGVSVEFRTEPNAAGSTQVQILVTDSSGRTSSMPFTLTVESRNDTPTFPNPVRNQAVNVGAQTPPLAFTVTDVETAAGDLTLTAVSDHDNVVPDANIFFAGSGSQRTVTVIPAQPSTNGRATIRVRAKDTSGDAATDTGEMVFDVDFSTPVGFPTVSPFAAVSMKEDESKSLGFTVRSGSSVPVDSLVLGVTSDTAPQLIPSSNVSITGVGSERTLTITPLANQNSFVHGQAQLTITVSDGNRSSHTSFFVTVEAVNDKPFVTPPSPQFISEDTETAILDFQVTDVETTDYRELDVVGRSSNPSIVPSGITDIGSKQYGIFITQGTNPRDRTVKVVPLPNAFGRITISLDVTDDALTSQGKGAETATGTFVVDIRAVNDPPSIGVVNGILLADNVNDAPLALTILEDTGVIASDNIQAQSITLGESDTAPARFGIYPGVLPYPAGAPLTEGRSPLNEIEQTVTISAAVDKPNIISSVFFDPGDDAKVKYSKTQTSLRFKLVPDAYGEVVVTLTLTDNGTGALGSDNLTTVRKFKINVQAANDDPSLTVHPPNPPAGLPQGQAIAIPIELKDKETLPQNMSMRATSSNQSIVNDANLVFDASNSVLSVIPNNITGDVTIEVVGRDRGPTDDAATPNTIPPRKDTPPASFVLRFRDLPVNHPPALSALSTSAATIQEDGLATATVIISDPDGAADVNGAQLSASSSNTGLISSSGVLFGGTGANRSIAFRPAAHQNGFATLTIVATDPGGFSSASQKFDLTVVPVEDSPSISVTRSDGDNTPWKDRGVPGRIEADEDASPVPDGKRSSGLIEVVVSDPETGVDSLAVTGKSNNQNLVPDANIVISATGGTRTVSISPVANRSGDALITLEVKDGAGRTTTDQFVVRILPKNDAPTINNPVPTGVLSVAENAPLQSISLSGITAGPEEGGQATNPNIPAQTLTITARANDKGTNPDDHRNTLIQSTSGDVLEVTPSSLTASTSPLSSILRFRPIEGKNGVSTIRITVRDNNAAGGDPVSTTVSFDVEISEFNSPPTIFIPSSFLDKVYLPNTDTGVIPITIEDAETPASQLTLSFSSSNPTLVPNTPETFQETGSGANRGVIIRPVPDLFGTANVTIVVTDKGRADGTDVKTASQVIRVTVSAGQAPSISNIPNMAIQKNTDTPIINFTVNDAQTPANQLTVTATSSFQQLVPDGNIQFGGTGANRAMIIRPAPDRSGQTIIRVTVRDTDTPANTSFDEFTLTVLGAPPTISDIADRVNLPQGGSTGTIQFQVNDAETFPGLLTITATSANKTIVPDANIFLGGNDQNRTVNVVLAANETGSSVITLRVTDGEGQSTTETFIVGTTAPVQDVEAPTISAISNQETVVNTALPIISFTVDDDVTPADDLRLTATSSNSTLVPSTAIFFGGSGAGRTVLISPAADQVGTSTIILTVTDATGKTGSRSFTVTVRSGEPEPSVVNDFNNDRLPDIILQDDGGFLAAWFMSGDDVLSSSFFSPNGTGDSGWKAIATGDFNKDNKTDLLFQHPDSSLAVWYMDGVTLSSAEFINPVGPGAADWKAEATGDFNKDGNVDILFQHTDGTLGVWYLNGVNLVSAAFLNPDRPSDPRWRVVGTGDVNRDTDVDIIFQLDDGTLGIWYLRGASLLAGGFVNPDNSGADWRVAGTIDLNQDGRVDLLLQNRVTSDTGVWYMNGPNLISGGMIMPAGGTWKIVAP
jgi:hypothetical protein